MSPDEAACRNRKTDIAFFKDEDLLHFTAYVKGPDDSLYRHKLVKLKFDIPINYPFVPPKVTFVQHKGQRIHPNLYVDGKVCLSILGTWPGEPWAFGMTCDSVLITIRSLLDNQPYCHEPNQRDNPAFNKYVRYTTWRWLLLDYLQHETDPAARIWLRRYLRRNGPEMLTELRRQAQHCEPEAAVPVAARAPRPLAGQDKLLHSPYRRSEPISPDYARLLEDLEAVWMSTMADESLNVTSGIGSKRKIDTVDSDSKDNTGEAKPSAGQHEHPQQSNEVAASQSPLVSPPLPSSQSTEEASQRPKKRAKGESDHVVIDLT